MCVDGEYVQKNAHMYIHTAAAAIFLDSLFLNFRTRARPRPLVYFHTFPLRNIANKEKNRRCRRLDLAYVVGEITKKNREREREEIKSSPLHCNHQRIGIAIEEEEEEEERGGEGKKDFLDERTFSFDRMENCNCIFSSLITFRDTLWKARHPRQRQRKEKRRRQGEKADGIEKSVCVLRSES